MEKSSFSALLFSWSWLKLQRGGLNWEKSTKMASGLVTKNDVKENDCSHWNVDTFKQGMKLMVFLVLLTRWLTGIKY